MTTPPSFDDAAILSVFDKVVSHALSTGRFDQVNEHEPKDVPGHGITCAIWAQEILPLRTSGLAATTGELLLNVRLYQNFRSQPFDNIDKNLLGAVVWLMAAYSADFDFGQVANVREVDLLGSYGASLRALAGYVEIDRTVMRVMTISVPIIINDMFVQVSGG